MKNWYTADPHFFHQAIIRHCNRPFANFDEMNDAIMKNLLKHVKPGDNLWMVGDFAFSKANHSQIRALFDRIPGQKHLIKGNHDDKRILGMGWASVADMRTVKDGDQRFFLCHYPMLTWPASRYNCVHLFGHVHNNWLGSKRAMNVGVDHWNFEPIDKAAIMDRCKNLPSHPLWEENEPGAGE